MPVGTVKRVLIGLISCGLLMLFLLGRLSRVTLSGLVLNLRLLVRMLVSIRLLVIRCLRMLLVLFLLLIRLVGVVGVRRRLLGRRRLFRCCWRVLDDGRLPLLLMILLVWSTLFLLKMFRVFMLLLRLFCGRRRRGVNRVVLVCVGRWRVLSVFGILLRRIILIFNCLLKLVIVIKFRNGPASRRLRRWMALVRVMLRVVVGRRRMLAVPSSCFMLMLSWWGRVLFCVSRGIVVLEALDDDCFVAY